MKKGIKYKFCVPARNCGKTDKFTKLYNTIKHKSACAQRDLEIEKNKSVSNLIKLEQLKGQIDAYNDMLSLMESMK